MSGAGLDIPDLEGVWTSDNNFSIPLERPAEVADKEFLDGKELEDALARRARGAVGGLVGGHVPDRLHNNVQILQAPGVVTITHEMMHDTRVIPLDGRPHISPRIRQYMGDSRARWDRTTLGRHSLSPASRL